MDNLLKILALACCVVIAAAQSPSPDQVPVPTIRNVVVEVGEKVRLRCPPNSDSANISWYRNDLPLNSSKVRVRVLQEWVRFRDVKLEDTGIYRCKIVSGRNVGWRNVSITVQNSGANVQRDQSVKPRDITLGARTPEKRTRALDPELEDETQVEVNTEQREKRETLTPPSFTKPDQMHEHVAKPAGSILRLRCLSDGNPTPNITWYKNKKHPSRLYGNIRRKAWALTAEDLIPEDSGNYTCVVCNTQGCIEHTFRVDVIERIPHKPYINPGYPKNLTVQVNGTADFECRIISDLDPWFEWLRVAEYPGEGVGKPEGISIQTSGPEVVNPDQLRLHNVTHKDEGWYTCIARNVLGMSFSSAYLRVVDSLEEEGSTTTLRNQPSLVNMTASINFNVSCAGQVCNFAALGSFLALPQP